MGFVLFSVTRQVRGAFFDSESSDSQDDGDDGDDDDDNDDADGASRSFDPESFISKAVAKETAQELINQKTKYKKGMLAKAHVGAFNHEEIDNFIAAFLMVGIATCGKLKPQHSMHATVMPHYIS